MLNSNLASFQNGVNSIYSTCSAHGVTPSEKTPTGISNAIVGLINNYYNTGYSAGVNAGTSAYGVQASGTFNVTLDAHPSYANITTVYFGQTFSFTPYLRIRTLSANPRICICVFTVATSYFQYVAVNWNNHAGTATFQWSVYKS